MKRKGLSRKRSRSVSCLGNAELDACATIAIVCTWVRSHVAGVAHPPHRGVCDEPPLQNLTFCLRGVVAG